MSTPFIISPFTSNSKIVVGNGSSLPISHIGHASIPSTSSNLRLHNVLVAPQIIKNLISIHALTRNNVVSVEFDPSGLSVKDLCTGMMILRCDNTGDLYPLITSGALTFSHALFAATSSVDLWHQWLGHPALKASFVLCVLLISHVIKQLLHLAMLVSLVNTLSCHLLPLHLLRVSPFSLSTVMLGPPKFLATPVSNII